MDIIIKIKNYINRNRLLFILFAIIISTVCTMLFHFANVEENSHWYNDFVAHASGFCFFCLITNRWAMVRFSPSNMLPFYYSFSND